MRYSNLSLVWLVALMITTSVAVQNEAVTKMECPAVVVPCQAKQSEGAEKPTILAFYIELDFEQSKDFIQLSLTVKQKDNSLKKAIDKIKRKVESIMSACEAYCNKNHGKNCNERVEVQNFEVDSAYQIIRREPNFNGFVVTHNIKIVVKEAENVGELIDTLLGLGIYQINDLQWKPEVEIDATQKAIDAGMTKGKDLCQHINRRMGTVLSIEEVFFDEEDEQKNDEQQPGNQDDEEQEKQSAVLEFKIECVDKTEQEKAETKRKAEVDKGDKKKKKK